MTNVYHIINCSKRNGFTSCTDYSCISCVYKKLYNLFGGDYNLVFDEFLGISDFKMYPMCATDVHRYTHGYH